MLDVRKIHVIVKRYIIRKKVCYFLMGQGVKMTKKEWLDEEVFRDIYGRPYNLSDVPMTVMTREESFKKQGGSKEDIDEYWKKNKHLYQKESLKNA
jgi:hypothetical protein